MPAAEYDRNVFINCPFDNAYAPIFEAIIFAVHDAGFRPKCARERLDSGEVRLQKILSLISESRFSIHDLSRTELDDSNQLPRFNMPFELGIDVGCKTYSGAQKDKSFLIFDSEKYRFQKYITDIAGQDIQHHADNPKVAVKRVRDWLRTESGRSDIPGGSAMYKRYESFREDLPRICEELKLDLNELTFVDFSQIVATWLQKQLWLPSAHACKARDAEVPGQRKPRVGCCRVVRRGQAQTPGPLLCLPRCCHSIA
jgi:hypothetical protein